MAAVLVPTTCQAEILMELDGQGIENTLWFKSDSSWDPAGLETLCESLIAWWEVYSEPLSFHLALKGVKATDWTTVDGPQVTVPTTVLTIGGQTNQSASPNNVAPCITFHTAKRGRANRGRNYICGVPQVVVNSNDVSQAWADAMQAAYMQLLTVATNASCTWVIASRFSGVSLVNGKKVPTPRAVGVTEPVTSASFKDLTVDSQRRRLPRH